MRHEWLRLMRGGLLVELKRTVEAATAGSRGGPLRSKWKRRDEAVTVAVERMAAGSTEKDGWGSNSWVQRRAVGEQEKGEG